MTDELIILSTMALIILMFSSIIVEINKEKVIEETKFSLREFKKMKNELLMEIERLESEISESKKQELDYMNIDLHKVSLLFSKKTKLRRVEKCIDECEEILERIS